MGPVKWDGFTNLKDILKALLYYIDEDDKASAMAKSYGDFAIDLRRAHKKESIGNSEFRVEGHNMKVSVTLHEYGGVEYELTWNKAAKLLHTYFRKKEEEKCKKKRTGRK